MGKSTRLPGTGHTDRWGLAGWWPNNEGAGEREGGPRNTVVGQPGRGDVERGGLGAMGMDDMDARMPGHSGRKQRAQDAWVLGNVGAVDARVSMRATQCGNGVARSYDGRARWNG
jgi:hypothetical protein